MAMGLLRKKLADRGLESKCKVRSAGVWGLDGSPASPNAVEVMAERGVDITDHVAHAITSADVAEASLILVMERDQLALIRSWWPQYAWKVHLLSEMSGQRKDVEDPYGGPLEAYRRCADLLSSYIEQGLERILSLA